MNPALLFTPTKKTYYDTCPYCKANLDPGERCDCTEESKDEKTTDEERTEK